MKVSLHKSGQFKKMIGGELFYLGKDEADAIRRAAEIKTLHLSVGKTWGQISLPQAKALAAGQQIQQVPQVAPQVPQIAPQPQIGHAPQQDTPIVKTTLKALLGLYRDYVETSKEWENKSEKYRVNEALRATKLVPMLNGLGSTRLDGIQREQIVEIVAHIASRPSNYSRKYTVDLIDTLKRCLEWGDYSTSINWYVPRGFDKAFKIGRKSIAITDADRLAAAEKHKTFNDEELRELWAKARNNQRELYFLLGLNCGFTQSEISSLMAGEVDLDNSRIKRIRPKSGLTILGEWKLWPLTRQRLQRYMRGKEYADTDIVFTTKHGNPIVHGKTDGVRLTWDRWTKKIELRKGLSFKNLRKTGSQWVKNAGGSDMSELYLAHTDKSTGRFYNDGDYKRLSQILDDLWPTVSKLLWETD